MESKLGMGIFSIVTLQKHKEEEEKNNDKTFEKILKADGCQNVVAIDTNYYICVYSVI